MLLVHVVCGRHRDVQYQKRGYGKDAEGKRSAMERRGLKISKNKTEILKCSERDYLEIEFQGETVKRVKPFK